MDPTGAEALTALTGVVQSFLPAVNDPLLAPSVAIVPVSVSLIGVGGFVGMNTDPVGEIVGRRVEAQVVITAMARDAAALQTAAAGISTGLLSDRSALEASGILRIRLANSGEREDSPGGVGGSP